MKRHSQRGVALVITLILLSVITFMAVTFLVVSRHEGTQVEQINQQANAKYATEAAFEQAKIQILAPMLAQNNGFLNTNNGYFASMIVSTNWITNYYNGGTNLTDVSYNGNGVPLTAAQMQAMLNNLLILPRVPVFIVTNKNFPNNVDFRFYNDMNRNGIYDESGIVPVTNATGVAVIDPVSGLPVFTSSPVVGDPEWIGILNHPEQRHSASNFFIGRYCFIVLPIGNSLDINYIHNHAKNFVPNPLFSEGFLRDEGVGSYEINLAGFLNGLITNTASTNYWGYNYTTNINNSSIGIAPNGPNDAFADAYAVLQYRYNNNYVASLPSFNTMFATTPGGNVNAKTYFANDFIDGYAAGPLLGTNLFMPSDGDNLILNSPWPGADNTNQYFTVQDIFNHAGATFVNHMRGASVSPATEDRYAFYRMLSQLSLGSAPEPASYPYNAANNTNFSSAYPNAVKMNLNYDNLHLGANGVASATNFIPWTPINFFTNAADRMLRAYFPSPVGTAGGVFTYLSITNIPIYPTNYYTPAVQRILQLAANMWDASTNRPFQSGQSPGDPFYPTVFRPLFNTNNFNGVTAVMITSYVEDISGPGPKQSYSFLPLSLPEDLSKINQGGPTLSIYGIPWVIGAKKGLPSFNQFELKTAAAYTRKVQLVRLHPGDTLTQLQTNIQYQLSISNLLGASVWNSYRATYPRGVQITGTSTISMSLAASADGITPGITVIPLNTVTNPIGPTNVLLNTWRGYNYTPNINASVNMPSFVVPMNTAVTMLSSATYHQTPSPTYFTLTTNFDTGVNPTYYQPHFMLFITNKLRFIMTDNLTGKVIDYVNLNFNDGSLNQDITALIANTNFGNNHGGIWDLTRVTGAGPNGPINGVNNQISISQGGVGDSSFGAFILGQNGDWSTDQLNPGSQSQEVQGFKNFLFVTPTNGSVQVPFTPTKVMYISRTWAANDPLVHYTTNDLAPLPSFLAFSTNAPPKLSNAIVITNLSTMTPRFEPWGDTANVNPNDNKTNQFNMLLKDALITKPDDWQFPTNRYPSVGWLGRVHRGTPWQTVYLKAGAVDTNTWMNWTGDSVINTFNSFDYLVSQPIQDYLLMDLFTASPNDNSSRGQLSVNQSGLAAWAAVLDGVMVVSNSPTGLIATNISPLDTFQFQPLPAPPTNTVQFLVNSINAVRAAAPGGTFTSLGQILTVTNLTTTSPYLNLTANTSLLRDADYERIPQQIMGLLRIGTPRYVIFAYGQSLKPADGSIVTSGKYFGMPTNYTITGEMATRTVMRIDNFPTPNSPAGTPITPRAVIESYNVLPPE